MSPVNAKFTSQFDLCASNFENDSSTVFKSGLSYFSFSHYEATIYSSAAVRYLIYLARESRYWGKRKLAQNVNFASNKR